MEPPHILTLRRMVCRGIAKPAIGRYLILISWTVLKMLLIAQSVQLLGLMLPWLMLDGGCTGTSRYLQISRWNLGVNI